MEEQKSGGSSVTRWIFVALAVYLFVQFGWPKIMGTSSSDRQPLYGLIDHLAPPAASRPGEQTCTLKSDRFTAELSTRGGHLNHLVIANKQYAQSGKPLDLVTTTEEDRMPLRSTLRPATLDGNTLKPSENLVAPDDKSQQVAFDDLDYKLTASDDKHCEFTFEDETTRVTKTVAITGGPYELGVTLKVDNLGDQPKKHRLSVETTAWRTEKDMAGHLGRDSEWQTEMIVSSSSTTERFRKSNFEPSDFKKKEFNDEKWRQIEGTAKFAAVSSAYFSSVIASVDAPKVPRVEAQAEERWDKKFADKTKDPDHGFVFRARVTYPQTELAPKTSATYKLVTFNGPKERDVLAAVGHDISGVINLGYFSIIGKGLVMYLYKLEAITRSWGWAIVLLTITVRLLVFPLSLAQIKHTVAMRKLKPEMDAINARYKDDMTQRGVATQELFRRHGMSQFSFATGCLPMLLQLPVWWALYSALQTAVELYHTPFLWFADLSAPDKFYIIPVILGASSFLQQKLMPAQGTDPQQQKMMMYMMPGIFTVMMLFLPSGLGVYMLTSSLVSIGQQFVVEKYLRNRSAGGSGGIIVKVQDGETPPALGKGKARVRG